VHAFTSSLEDGRHLRQPPPFAGTTPPGSRAVVSASAWSWEPLGGGKIVALHVGGEDRFHAAHLAQTRILPSSMIYTADFSAYRQSDGSKR